MVGNFKRNYVFFGYSFFSDCIIEKFVVIRRSRIDFCLCLIDKLCFLRSVRNLIYEDNISGCGY